jgi:hypothetical protein
MRDISIIVDSINKRVAFARLMSGLAKHEYELPKPILELLADADIAFSNDDFEDIKEFI